MSTDFKVIRQMLLDYQANPVPLTPLGYYYLDMMIQYHRNYNEWYNNLGSNHEQEQNQGPTTTPAVAAPSLPSTPISRNLAVEEPTATQETVIEGEQPQMPSRRISRRLTARPRRLFQEEIALCSPPSSPARGTSVEQLIRAPVRSAPFSRLNKSKASEEEKERQSVETPKRPNRGIKRRNEQMEEPTPKRLRIAEDR